MMKIQRDIQSEVLRFEKAQKLDKFHRDTKSGGRFNIEGVFEEHCGKGSLVLGTHTFGLSGTNEHGRRKVYVTPGVFVGDFNDD